jgi:phytoene dehydrogenase-like protein
MKDFYINRIVNPKGLKKDQYDVIIIGAGIGGLVCGCYLAKAGMKVLIVERHNRVGGYCTSFRRKHFIFDAAVHSFGNFAEGKPINKIFKELNIADRIRIKRSNPSDIIKIKDFYLEIDNDFSKTQDAIIHYFPKERRNIINFFTDIKKAKALDWFIQLKNKTFLDYLHSYFHDEKLVNILSFPLGNIGLPAKMTAAFSGVILYRDFIFDGGYYPEGGMQNLANNFLNVFDSFGGDILTGVKVEKIILNKKKVIGVEADKQQIYSPYVISNCDAYQTFFKLMDPNILSRSFMSKIRKGMPSISSYILYLGLNQNIKNYLKECCTFWYFDDFNINEIYDLAINNKVSIPPRYFLATFPSMHEAKLAPQGKSILSLIVGVPFKNSKYWQSARRKMADSLTEKAKNIIDNIEDLIELKIDATPHTLYKYTLNNRGAMCGWASTLKQVYENRIDPQTEIEGLYLTGHWATPPAGQGGIDVVMYSGKTTARLVKSNFKKRRYTR